MQFEKIVADSLGVSADAVNDDLSLDNCAEWTSLTHIALLTNLESTYGIQFDIEESIEMDSVGSIREILSSKGVVLDA